jgi:omega-3 fatty acid desaturase (delta-15 desaturase)
MCAVLLWLMTEAEEIGWSCLFPVYWFLQGTMFWALFVIAHDCGHGSFSSMPLLNDTVGLLLSSLILVPYAPWRLSHRSHHKNAGNIDKDEIFFPVRKKEGQPKFLMYFGLGVGWFLYLLYGYQNRGGSHFDINAPKLQSHRGSVALSLVTWSLSLMLLGVWAFCTSLTRVLFFYFLPLFVFATWLVVTTFLHHNDNDVPWYGDTEWEYVKGNLSSVDRDYGILHEITHSIGTHQVHHLFPIIPHYRLKEATRAFRTAYPHLSRTSNEPILAAFFRIFHLVTKQLTIADDASVHVYTP